MIRESYVFALIVMVPILSTNESTIICFHEEKLKSFTSTCGTVPCSFNSYCGDDGRCLYCSDELCRSPPAGCELSCETRQKVGGPEASAIVCSLLSWSNNEMATTAEKCGLRENRVLNYNTLLISLCITSALCVILLVLLVLVCREQLLEFIKNKILNKKAAIEMSNGFVVNSSEHEKQTTALLISGRTATTVQIPEPSN